MHEHTSTCQHTTASNLVLPAHYPPRLRTRSLLGIWTRSLLGIWTRSLLGTEKMVFVQQSFHRCGAGRAYCLQAFHQHARWFWLFHPPFSPLRPPALSQIAVELDFLKKRKAVAFRVRRSLGPIWHRRSSSDFRGRLSTFREKYVAKHQEQEQESESR